MAGIDKEYDGEAAHMPGIKIGYLSQEPQLDPNKNVVEMLKKAWVKTLTLLIALMKSA